MFLVFLWYLYFLNKILYKSRNLPPLSTNKPYLQDLRREVQRLKAVAGLSEAGVSRTPPRLVLPSMAPSSNAGTGGLTEMEHGVVSDEMPPLSLQLAGDGSDGAEEGQQQRKPSGDGVDTADEVADELIKVRMI